MLWIIPENEYFLWQEGHRFTQCQCINTSNSLQCTENATHLNITCADHVMAVQVRRMQIIPFALFPYDETPSQRPVQPQTTTPYRSIPALIAQGTQCTVCYNDKELISLGCRHVLCYSCLSSIRVHCPVCREGIVERYNRRI